MDDAITKLEFVESINNIISDWFKIRKMLIDLGLADRNDNNGLMAQAVRELLKKHEYILQ